MMLPGLTSEEARDLLLSVGTHHGKRRLSPVEVARLFGKAIASGATPMTCARFVNLTGPAMIPRFLRLLRLSSTIQHLVDWGQTGSTLAFASAWRLGNLNEDEQETVAREAIANQMGKEEVRQVIQLRKRSKRGVEKCIAEVLRMRSVVDRRHVFLGAITDEKVRRSLAKLKQNDRDGLIAASMESSYGPMLNTSGRLGIERFTIVTDQNGAARLRGPGGSDFEVVINRQLAARVVKA